MNVLSSLMQGFELENFLPGMSSYLGGFIFWMFFLMLIGPVVMILLGVLYRFYPRQELNHKLGFRLHHKITAANVWAYTQNLAGMAYMLVGGVLAGLSIVIGTVLAIISVYALVVGALIIVIIETLLTAALWLGINMVVDDIFDDRGQQRKGSKYAKIKFLKP